MLKPKNYSKLKSCLSVEVFLFYFFENIIMAKKDPNMEGTLLYIHIAYANDSTFFLWNE